MRTIFTCENLTEASFMKARLENNGIQSYLTNQHFTTLLPMYNNMLGSGIQLMVSEEHVQEAREILRDKIDPQSQELVCSNCGSDQISLGIGKQKSVKIWAILISLFAFIPMGNLKPSYTCKNCEAELK